MAETPFDSLQAAHEYVGLLLEAVRDTRGDVAEDLAALTGREDEARTRDALRLVAWKLERLESHLDGSRRLLHDLSRLRRLLVEDAAAAAAPLGEAPKGTQ